MFALPLAPKKMTLTLFTNRADLDVLKFFGQVGALVQSLMPRSLQDKEFLRGGRVGG